MVVELPGFFDAVLEEVAAPWGAGPFNVCHDGRSTDVEPGRQRVDELALAVLLNESLHFVCAEAMVELADRSGSSSGWLIAVLTTENVLKCGHVVVVGVTAHQLHS